MSAGKITGMVVQAKNKERVNIFIDDEFSFGLAMIEALKLRKGQILSDSQIAELKSLDEIEVAYNSALHFLAFRPRSIAEVRRNLEEKQYSPHTIEVVLARLTQASLLDDEAFARYWVENRNQFRPRGSRALRAELRSKGVADDAIRQALEDLSEDGAARQAARSQAKRLVQLPKKEFNKRLGDFLLRRGFGYGTIRTVADELWEEFSHEKNDEDDTFDTEWGA